MDALELLKQMSDQSVDLVLTDPPYFNQGTQKKYSRKGHKDVNTNFGDWDKFESDEDYIKWMKIVICELCRVLKDNGSLWIFTNDRYISYLRHFIRDIEGMNYASTIIWHKYNSPPRFIMKAGFISSMEMIMFAYKGKKPIFNKPKIFKEMFNVWITPQTPSGERLGHPTQKPISLISKIIETSSNSGDLVFDCFNGSGTTTLVCKQLNRKYIGVELSEEYCKMAEKRLSQNVLLPLDVKQDGGNRLPPTDKSVGIRPTIL